VSRLQLVAGKYAGLVLTLAVNVSVMTVALYAVLAYMNWTALPEARAGWERPALDPALLKAIALIFVELMIVTAIALFFSTFSSPILAAALTFGMFLAGQFNADLKHFDRVTDSPAAAALARGLYHLLPDLSAFDVKTEVVHGLAVPAGYVVNAAAYGAVYIAALLLAATVVFSRRDFK
jgi:ABC-type transport system involved in multi-copper enzyme maturation permease subunit